MESKEEILKIMGGIPEEAYDAIVLVFYQEARQRLAGIKLAIESNNLEGVSQGAHAIKGSAGNLRLMQIQDMAKSLEDAAKAKNAAGMILCQEELLRLIP